MTKLSVQKTKPIKKCAIATIPCVLEITDKQMMSDKKQKKSNNAWIKNNNTFCQKSSKLFLFCEFEYIHKVGMLKHYHEL